MLTIAAILACAACGIAGYLYAESKRREAAKNPDILTVQTLHISIRLNRPVPGSIALQIADDIRKELENEGIPMNDPRVDGNVYAEDIRVRF